MSYSGLRYKNAHLQIGWPSSCYRIVQPHCPVRSIASHGSLISKGNCQIYSNFQRFHFLFSVLCGSCMPLCSTVSALGLSRDAFSLSSLQCPSGLAGKVALFRISVVKHLVPGTHTMLFKDWEDGVLQQNSIFGTRDKGWQICALFFLFCWSGVMSVGLNLLRIHSRCSHITSRLVTAGPSLLTSPQIYLRKKKALKIIIPFQEVSSFQHRKLCHCRRGTSMTEYHKISCLRKKLTWKTRYEKHHAKLWGCSPNGNVITNIFIFNLLQTSSISEVAEPIWFHSDELFLKFSVE